MKLAEVRKLLNEDGELPRDQFIKLESGDWEVDGKIAFRDDVYQHNLSGKYFQVQHSRDNCGYWSDGQSYNPEISLVEPVVISKTIYKLVEEK